MKRDYYLFIPSSFILPASWYLTVLSISRQNITGMQQERTGFNSPLPFQTDGLLVKLLASYYFRFQLQHTFIYQITQGICHQSLPPLKAPQSHNPHKITGTFHPCCLLYMIICYFMFYFFYIYFKIMKSFQKIKLNWSLIRFSIHINYIGFYLIINTSKL